MTLQETIQQADKRQTAYLVELERRWFELMVIVSAEDTDTLPGLELPFIEEIGSLALVGAK